MTTHSVALAAIALAASGCLAFHPGAPPDAPPNATFVVVAGAPIRFLDVGEGPAVVLLHGYGGSSAEFDELVPVLAERHRVVALDLKGFGFSGRPAGDYSPAAEARVVLDVMNARGVPRAAIVAHSWGSSVALALALAAPERVTRLALIGAFVYEEQLSAFVTWSRASGVGEALFAAFYGKRPETTLAGLFYDKARYVTEARVEAYERAQARPGTEAAALAVARGMRFSETQGRYATVDKPALVLWGREDEVALLTYGERLARELPRGRLVVYPRCGHVPMVEAKAEVNADLARFLDEDLP